MRAVERLLRSELPNILVEVGHRPFPSNIVPEFLKFLSIDCPTMVCVHELEYFTPLLIGKLLFTSTFSILFVEGYKLLVGDGTTIVLVDAIKKVFCFGMVQRGGNPRGKAFLTRCPTFLQMCGGSAICEHNRMRAQCKVGLFICNSASQ